MNYNLKRCGAKMYKVKNNYFRSVKDYVREEPLIVINETNDMGSNTVVENLDIISLQELIELQELIGLHSKFTFLNRLKFLLTGNLRHHNESTNQSLERRTTHEPINRNRTRNKP